MTHIRSWIPLLCLVFMSVFVTLGGVSPLAHADAKYAVNTGNSNTLWGISKVHHTTETTLREDNHLRTTLLQIKQTLSIPGPKDSYLIKPHVMKMKGNVNIAAEKNRTVIHTVQSGDTLWQLALENDTSVSNLLETNHLHSTCIYPGQRIEIRQGVQQLPRNMDTHLDTKIVDHKGIPVNLIPVYQAAGNRYGIPWTVLAAIHRKETNFATTQIVSSAGAQGPMQFMPSTFRKFGVTAPGQHGAPDINNVYDAIYTAAHMLAVDGYSRNPASAIYHYNHSLAYVQSVQQLARAYQV